MNVTLSGNASLAHEGPGLGHWGSVHDRLAAADAARKAWLDAHPDNRVNPKNVAAGAKGKGVARTQKKEPRLRTCIDCGATWRGNHHQIRCDECRQKERRDHARGAAARARKAARP